MLSYPSALQAELVMVSEGPVWGEADLRILARPGATPTDKVVRAYEEIVKTLDRIVQKTEDGAQEGHRSGAGALNAQATQRVTNWN